MSLRSLKDMARRVGFRLTFWYSSIFVFSAIFLFCVTYFVFSAYLARQEQDNIRSKVKALLAAYNNGGLRALEREVNIDQKAGRGGAFLIRVAGPEGTTHFLMLPYQWLGFDLKALEMPGLHEEARWFRLNLKGGSNQLVILSVPLNGGLLLQVGKSNEERNEILSRFRLMFAGIMVPLVLIGAAGGIFVTFRTLRPIRHLIHTVQSVYSGQLDARVPSLRTGDELDQLVTLFNQMLTKIDTLIREMKESLDNVAHDLRTPVSRLRATAEMALQSNGQVSDLREALSDCLEESELILRMLNTLMDISEAETGTINLHKAYVQLSSLVEQIEGLYAYVSDEKGITVYTHCPDHLFAFVDADRMRQALANLLDNAVKYTPQGGEVEIKAEQQGNQVVLSVRDSGCGISPEDLPKIWDRLYRGDRSRSQKGLGLGLSLVKAIIHAHEGRIEAESEPGKGSTFRIYLPLPDSLDQIPHHSR
jgi:signal transduction histidine kinase